MDTPETVRSLQIKEADKNLDTMKLNIERLKALGVDTTDLQKTYDFLSTRIGFIKQE